MKHSTFYKNAKGEKRVYTTIKNTQHHQFLRDDCGGKTYQHPDDAYLYFVEGVPLDKPFTKYRSNIKRVK